jgi:hypothetical protein
MPCGEGAFESELGDAPGARLGLESSDQRSANTHLGEPRAHVAKSNVPRADERSHAGDPRGDEGHNRAPLRISKPAFKLRFGLVAEPSVQRESLALMIELAKFNDRFVEDGARLDGVCRYRMPRDHDDALARNCDGDCPVQRLKARLNALGSE